MKEGLISHDYILSSKPVATVLGLPAFSQIPTNFSPSNRNAQWGLVKASFPNETEFERALLASIRKEEDEAAAKASAEASQSTAKQAARVPFTDFVQRYPRFQHLCGKLVNQSAADFLVSQKTLARKFQVIHFDSPYGTTKQAWDVELTEAELAVCQRAHTELIRLLVGICYFGFRMSGSLRKCLPLGSTE